MFNPFNINPNGIIVDANNINIKDNDSNLLNEVSKFMKLNYNCPKEEKGGR